MKLKRIADDTSRLVIAMHIAVIDGVPLVVPDRSYRVKLTNFMMDMFNCSTCKLIHHDGLNLKVYLFNELNEVNLKNSSFVAVDIDVVKLEKYDLNKITLVTK